MRPLILHNVPDDELYTGDDGVQRPYAMIFPDGQQQPRRRAVAETGSFGKSARRSRSRGSSAVPKREDATMQSADRIFSDYIASQQERVPSAATGGAQRKFSQAGAGDDSGASHAPRFSQEPTEVILRGYKSASQQYAAINHYEQLAGRVCEDYPREPPIEQRRYKSELRDPAFTRRQALTPQERVKVNQVDGGEHWIKLTFESAEAADAAIYASPQKILGHVVYAEPYMGVPPKEDAAVLDLMGDVGLLVDEQPIPQRSQSLRGNTRRPSSSRRPGKNSTLPRDWNTPAGSRSTSHFENNQSPGESQTSTQTFDSATVSATSGTASTATIMGGYPASEPMRIDDVDESMAAHNAPAANDSLYCRRIPTARRAKLMPAEQALLPQPGLVSRVISRIPLIKWFGGSMIGSEIPRTDDGKFDLAKASLYWLLMFYLDLWFGLFGHEIVGGDKDD